VDDQLPSVFIGSSTLGLDVSRELELPLRSDAMRTIRKDDVSDPMSVTNLLEAFDFATMSVG
jgi:hypothetical protein